jgi:hypothetical protein
MTFAQVAAAAETLVKQGRNPSGSQVFAHLKAQGHRVSKRTVRRLLADWHPQPPAPVLSAPLVEPDGREPWQQPYRPPGPAPAPVTAVAPVPPVVDPTVAAAAALRQAEQVLDDARDSLLHAKTCLLAVRPLLVDGILHGALHPHDELPLQALWDVDSAKQHYDTAWQQWDVARQRVTQSERQHLRQAQEAWVTRTRPELEANVAFWRESVHTATGDRQKAEAKKNYSQVLATYEHAVATAPVSVNGQRHEERHDDRA